MIYKDNAVKDLRIAYIGGGSRGWAWTFMRDLALEPALGGTIVLYDIDKEAAKANEVIGNGITKRPEAVGKWKYVVADTLAEALTGSDFVVISILPGTFDEMERMRMSRKSMEFISRLVTRQDREEWFVHSERFQCLLRLQRQFVIMHRRHGSLITRIRCLYA